MRDVSDLMFLFCFEKTGKIQATKRMYIFKARYFNFSQNI